MTELARKSRSIQKHRGVAGACVAALLLTACGTLPSWAPTKARDVEVTASYRLDDPMVPIILPVTTPDRKILELVIEPQPQKQEYRAGRRVLHMPEGTDSVRVRCVIRFYRQATAAATNQENFPDPVRLFPGADRVRHR